MKENRMAFVPCRAMLAGLITALAACSASAAWDPQNGDWGKEVETDLRVMTWNVRDGIVSTSTQKDSFQILSQWYHLALIVASMKPDVLILQEMGDRSGNGTGGGADSVSQLTNTVRDFFTGEFGADVNVQIFDPSYDLPHVFVSTSTDNFNRNVIVSKYPFVDLNGDGVSQVSFLFVIPGQDPVSGDSGIRGFQFAEIDLPDETYAGDVVVGNGHLKAFGDSNSQQQRIDAANVIAVYIDNQFNGAGFGVPDPFNRVSGASPTSVLDDFTPVIWGGDLNEDELTNGRRGPVSVLLENQTAGGTDGTDFDRTDSAFDNAVEPLSGDRTTLGGSKLDYLLHQDSKATLRRAFVFNSARPEFGPQQAPPEFALFSGATSLPSSFASDHRPVIADYDLVTTDELCDTTNPELDCDGNGLLDSCDLDDDPSLDCDNNGVLDVCDIADDPSLDCDSNGVLDSCEIAGDPGLDLNMNGELDVCDCVADLDPPGGDGALGFFDLVAYLTLFAAMDPAADLDPVGGDGQFGFFDLVAYLTFFAAGCV